MYNGKGEMNNSLMLESESNWDSIDGSALDPYRTLQGDNKQGTTHLSELSKIRGYRRRGFCPSSRWTFLTSQVCDRWWDHDNAVDSSTTAELPEGTTLGTDFDLNCLFWMVGVYVILKQVKKKVNKTDRQPKFNVYTIFSLYAISYIISYYK